MSVEKPRPFDMTIIVPVYNAEGYLRECVASIDSQTIRQERIEVLLVNDGSQDESLALCKELASSRPNYRVFSQENKGVSAARNVGIRNAKGRYLLFLDSDDSISKETVAHLVSTFDSFGNDVDLVSYAIEYRERETGRIHGHKRQQWMNKTAVYDIGDYPYLAQSTMNVCVRNSKETPLFREDMKMGEDQFFITLCLINKGKMGYCSEARYNYTRHEDSSSAKGDDPQYAFSDMMVLFEMLLNLASKNEQMAQYAYSLILYNVGWRFRQGKLFPTNEMREEGEKQIRAVLCQVPLQCWKSNPYLSDTLRVYLLCWLNILDSVDRIQYDESESMLVFDNCESLELSIPQIVIDWILNDKRGLVVKGYIYGPTFLYEGKPTLVIEVNGQERAVELKKSKCDDEGSGISITNAWRFELDLPPIGDRPFDLHFGVTFGNRIVPAISLRYETIRCNGRYVYKDVRQFGNWRLTIVRNGLHCGTIKNLPSWTMRFVGPALRLRDDIVRKKELPEKVGLRARAQKEKNIIWLYVDSADGNRLCEKQIKEDAVLHDGIRRIYVVRNSAEYKSVEEAGYEVVDVHDKEYPVYLLAAEKTISSISQLTGRLPFERLDVDRLADYRGKQQYIFLSESNHDISESAYDEIRILKY